MTIHRWRDLRAAVGTNRHQAEIEKAVGLEEQTFHELCKALQLTEAQVNELNHVTHIQAARVEAHDSRRIEQIREIVEVLGGQLEVFAVLGGKRVRVA